MSHQIIRTEGVDELVVMSRRDYDALRAAAGDEQAELRASAAIVREQDAAIARGEESVLPDWLSAAVLIGDNPVKAARLHRARTQEDLAAALGLTQGDLAGIESGRRATNPALRARLAAELDLEADWLSG